jgi:hypothetical protein
MTRYRSEGLVLARSFVRVINMKIFDAHSLPQGQRSLFIHRQRTLAHEDLLYSNDSDRLRDEQTMLGHNNQKDGRPSQGYYGRPWQSMQISWACVPRFHSGSSGEAGGELDAPATRMGPIPKTTVYNCLYSGDSNPVGTIAHGYSTRPSR